MLGTFVCMLGTFCCCCGDNHQAHHVPPLALEDYAPNVAEWLSRGQDQPEALASVDTRHGNVVQGEFQFPSGMWRKSFDQYGERTKGQLRLAFADGSVSGEGCDNIGRFSVSGFYNPVSGRVAFTKQYLFGSRPAGGWFPNTSENLGHAVEYRGQASRHLQSEGVRGSWYVSTSRYRGQGRFHLWPFAQALLAPSQGLTRASIGDDDPGDMYEVTDDQICIICVDRRIDVILKPCGHVAI